MNKIIVIAQREFLTAVTQPAYLVGMIGVPLLLLAIGLMFTLFIPYLGLSEDRIAVGVVDRSGVIDFSLVGDVVKEESRSTPGGGRLSIVRYESYDDGVRDLRGARLDGLYVTAANYLGSGEVEVYTREGRLLDSPAISAVRRLLRQSLLKNLRPENPGSANEAKETEAVVNRLLANTEPKRMTFNDDGSTAPVGGGFSTEIIPVAIVALLVFSVFNSAAYLLKSTAEEKENRVIEIMFSSVSPEQLLWGKILGLGAAALLQISAYLLMIGFSTFYLLTFISLTPAKLAMMFVYCVLGYLLFAGLLTATGVMGGNQRESMQLAGVWTLTALIPVWLNSVIVRAPNGTAARMLSFFPLTSPATMIARLSATSVPAVDFVISIALLIAGIFLVVRIAAVIFRTASLMYGKRITLPEAVRWLRQS